MRMRKGEVKTAKRKGEVNCEEGGESLVTFLVGATFFHRRSDRGFTMGVRGKMSLGQC